MFQLFVDLRTFRDQLVRRLDALSAHCSQRSYGKWRKVDGSMQPTYKEGSFIYIQTSRFLDRIRKYSELNGSKNSRDIICSQVTREYNFNLLISISSFP
jgi:hypothetical protein